MSVGQPPTARDRLLIEAAKESLAPNKSIARIDEYGKFLFGSLSVFTLLLTGLGVATDFKVDSSALWLLVFVLGPLAISLAAVIVAMWPSYATVDPNDIGSIETLFKKRLLRGSVAIGVAAGMFGVALLATIPVFVLMTKQPPAAPGEPSPLAIRPSFRYVVQPDLTRTLTVKIEAENIPDGATMTATILGRRGGADEVLVSETMRAESGSNVSVSADIPGAERYARFEARVRAVAAGNAGSKPLFEQGFEFTPR